MAMPISIESVEALLRLKLKERVAPGSTLLNTGFRLFGRPENGITVDNFRKTLATQLRNMVKNSKLVKVKASYKVRARDASAPYPAA